MRGREAAPGGRERSTRPTAVLCDMRAGILLHTRMESHSGKSFSAAPGPDPTLILHPFALPPRCGARNGCRSQMRPMCCSRLWPACSTATPGRWYTETSSWRTCEECTETGCTRGRGGVQGGGRLGRRAPLIQAERLEDSCKG